TPLFTIAASPYAGGVSSDLQTASGLPGHLPVRLPLLVTLCPFSRHHACCRFPRRSQLSTQARAAPSDVRVVGAGGGGKSIGRGCGCGAFSKSSNQLSKEPSAWLRYSFTAAPLVVVNCWQHRSKKGWQW